MAAGAMSLTVTPGYQRYVSVHPFKQDRVLFSVSVESVRYHAWSSAHSAARETRLPVESVDYSTRRFADIVGARHGNDNGITATALRNGSADTDNYGNGCRNG